MKKKKKEYALQILIMVITQVLLIKLIRYFIQQTTNKIMSQKLLEAFVSGITLGIVNINKNGVTFKDPITSTGNALATIKDAILNDFNKGVWIGKRQIEGFGFSSYATEIFNMNFQHYAVVIDGTGYHLKVSSKNNESIKIIELDQDYNNFEWFYKGKSERSISSVQRFIEKVNKARIQYNLVMSNCQDVAKAISFYARGIYSQQLAFQMIFPQSIETALLTGTGVKRISQMLVQGVSFIAP